MAGLVGALVGGSKYQVYGPTAAFISVIAGAGHAHHQQVEGRRATVIADIFVELRVLDPVKAVFTPCRS